MTSTTPTPPAPECLPPDPSVPGLWWVRHSWLSEMLAWNWHPTRMAWDTGHKFVDPGYASTAGWRVHSSAASPRTESDRLVTWTISIGRDGAIYGDTQTHGNNFADVYRGFWAIKAELERQISERRSCPYNPVNPQPPNFDDAEPQVMPWQPIATAPRDGTTVLVHAPAHIWDPAGPSDMDLPAITCTAAWHPDAGWCVDEVRAVLWWMPVPPAPQVTP